MQALTKREFEMDSSLLQQLFQDHHRMILNCAYRITGSRDDAEDVLQTVFMRLVGRDGLKRSEAETRGYLHRAATNTALDVVRSRKSSRRASLESMEAVLPGRKADGPEHRQSSSEIRNWLRQALGSLNPRWAEIFVLRHWEGMSNQEIADQLKTSPGTIAVTLHRCKNQLQQEMQSFLGGKS